MVKEIITAGVTAIAMITTSRKIRKNMRRTFAWIFPNIRLTTKSEYRKTVPMAVYARMAERVRERGASYDPDNSKDQDPSIKVYITPVRVEASIFINGVEDEIDIVIGYITLPGCSHGQNKHCVGG